MRLLVYNDYVYRRVGTTVYAERAFALFLVGLHEHVDELTIAGRLAPGAAATRYPLPAAVEFLALANFPSFARPVAALAALVRSLAQMWRAAGVADAAWVLGPSPHAIAFALIVLARRRPVVLGVRQDYPAYVRHRRPGNRWMHRAADVLETAWRLLARRLPVVAVGPDLARHYGAAPRVLTMTVSLVSAGDVEVGQAAQRHYDPGGELRILTVGRLDAEKNPLLLAEILAGLAHDGRDWRLTVCGEGPLAGELEAALRTRGVDDRTELVGYLPLHDGLLDLYRTSHVFLHVSLTEGLPQVLTEAFASGIPVVATAVGGVAEAAGDAAILIAPADAAAACEAVRRVVADSQLRAQLIARGFAQARAQTLERETARVVEFIRS